MLQLCNKLVILRSHFRFYEKDFLINLNRGSFMSGKKTMSVTTKSSIVAVVLAVTLFILIYQKLNGVVSYIIVVNVVTFIYYGIDKLSAKRGWNRTPEIVLHALAMAGGSPTAFLSQKLFHHKTAKTGFLFFYWFIVVLQLVLICFYFFKWAKG